ncbi:unnamed protein product [Cuscuta epithymum]|uniref:C2 domain-containing protein n=2 Tax=Cuscuta epithymum TaxID=186058 RepID=A0AAV0G938_9ASTE|nr:unnamed protein product [Cuscuta epithymum]
MAGIQGGVGLPHAGGTAALMAGNQGGGGQLRAAEKPLLTYIQVERGVDFPKDLVDVTVEVKVEEYVGKGTLVGGDKVAKAVLICFPDRVQSWLFQVKVVGKDKKVEGSTQLDYRDSGIISIDHGAKVAKSPCVITGTDTSRRHLMISVWSSRDQVPEGAVPATLPSSPPSAAPINTAHLSVSHKSYTQPKLAYYTVMLRYLWRSPSPPPPKPNGGHPAPIPPLVPAAFYYVVGKLGEQEMWTQPLYPPTPQQVAAESRLPNNYPNPPTYSPADFHFIGHCRLFFVVNDPMEADHDKLTLIVKVPLPATTPNKYDVLGSVAVPVDPNKMASHKDLKLKNGDKDPGLKLSAMMLVDKSYHVFDDVDSCTSDRLPTDRDPRQPKPVAIAVLEVAILSVTGLVPTKERNRVPTTDPYCVAKYGRKWCKTRTVIGSGATARFQEPYIWEVYDPNTVLTVGVFDNNQAAASGGKKEGDKNIGKVRVPISTLLFDGKKRIKSYPLYAIHPELGPQVRIMGELHLQVALEPTSMWGFVSAYFRPLLPPSHYERPIPLEQTADLRKYAVDVECKVLGRREPPLGENVVRFMTTAEQGYSKRVTDTNLARLYRASGLRALCQFVDHVASWKSPVTTLLSLELVFFFLLYADLIFPVALAYFIYCGIYNLVVRIWSEYPTKPPRSIWEEPPIVYIAQHQITQPDDLDEEGDTRETSRKPEVVKKRYDNLRLRAAYVQNVVGDLANQAERFQNILSWKNPCMTAIAMVLTIAQLILHSFVTGFSFVVAFCLLSHPVVWNSGYMKSLLLQPIKLYRRLPINNYYNPLP